LQEVTVLLDLAVDRVNDRIGMMDVGELIGGGIVGMVLTRAQGIAM
jgi:hypothetical protein